METGVRNSWDTLATKSRRFLSCSSLGNLGDGKESGQEFRLLLPIHQPTKSARTATNVTARRRIGKFTRDRKQGIKLFAQANDSPHHGSFRSRVWIALTFYVTCGCAHPRCGSPHPHRTSTHPEVNYPGSVPCPGA
jgi:hypothetical protein